MFAPSTAPTSTKPPGAIKNRGFVGAGVGWGRGFVDTPRPAGVGANFLARRPRTDRGIAHTFLAGGGGSMARSTIRQIASIQLSTTNVRSNFAWLRRCAPLRRQDDFRDGRAPGRNGVRPATAGGDRGPGLAGTHHANGDGLELPPPPGPDARQHNVHARRSAPTIPRRPRGKRERRERTYGSFVRTLCANVRTAAHNVRTFGAQV